MLSANALVALQDRLTRLWHEIEDSGPLSDALLAQAIAPSTSSNEHLWLVRVAEQHRANFELWHIEDEARTPNADDGTLAAVKRRIDKTNQHRNDLAEALDVTLLEHLASKSLPNTTAPLHSESAGLMIDRLSILSLKIYHTRLEAERQDAPAGHAERNQSRLDVLLDQRADLSGCLDALWSEVLAGSRRFKIYRQMKMYNDPSLNPAIYKKTGKI